MEACCLVRCYCKSFVNRVARARSNQMHSVTRPANLEDKVVSTSEFYLSPRYLTKCIGSFTYLKKDLSRFTQVAIKMEQVAPEALRIHAIKERCSAHLRMLLFAHCLFGILTPPIFFLSSCLKMRRLKQFLVSLFWAKNAHRDLMNLSCDRVDCASIHLLLSADLT
jgi:hypothetical protein